MTSTIRTPVEELLVTELRVVFKLFGEGWTPRSDLGDQRRLKRLREYGYLDHRRESGRRVFRLTDTAEEIVRHVALEYEVDELIQKDPLRRMSAAASLRGGENE